MLHGEEEVGGESGDKLVGGVSVLFGTVTASFLFCFVLFFVVVFI